MVTELTKNEPLVFHFRDGHGKNTKPKAGVTVVYCPVLDRFGIAICCAKDLYCKRWGKKIALERAIRGSSVRTKSRSRTRRFECAPEHKGAKTIQEIRKQAIRLAHSAVNSVHNEPMTKARTANSNTY